MAVWLEPFFYGHSSEWESELRGIMKIGNQLLCSDIRGCRLFLLQVPTVPKPMFHQEVKWFYKPHRSIVRSVFKANDSGGDTSYIMGEFLSFY